VASTEAGRPDDHDVGNRLDLESMYREESPRLARYFKARFRGTEDPDDLVQEVFTRLAAGLPFGELRDPQSYLKRILRNFLIDRNRKSRNAPGLVSMDGVEPSVPPDQAHAIEVTQMRQQYRFAVDALPPRTRQVFLLHRVQELSVKMIADRLDISTRTVEWHIGEAVLRIGKALEI
jgi:RNA polymerase sigma-70 factor (ECF subfamily)